MNNESNHGPMTLLDCMKNGGYSGIIFRRVFSKDYPYYEGRLYILEGSSGKTGREEGNVKFIDGGEPAYRVIPTAYLLKDRVVGKRVDQSKTGYGRM
ncbi:MAG: hypothetical protein Q7S27_01555 [Nanoarchaeota archaeon]|nr:hypothetical protein [Nanoarchaeota archaeon]